MLKKILFPIAGMGTRFLPFSKEIPKEMIPLAQKPLVQYAVEEGAASGITSFIYVVSRGKESLENYFCPNIELEYFLKEKNRLRLLQDFEKLYQYKHFFIRQPHPLGFGYAVSLAEAAVNEQPFGIILPDDLIIAPSPVFQQMLEVYKRYRCSLIAFMKVPFQDVSRYGIASGPFLEEKVFKIEKLIEKPSLSEAPSNYAIIGRYILTPTIFECLKEVQPGAGGEIQLTDAIKLLLQRENVLGYFFEGTRFDCGTVEGYTEAFLTIALQNEKFRQKARELLAETH